MMRTHRNNVAWMLATLSLFITGCASTGFVSNGKLTKNFVKATSHNPAVKCLCVWQTAEGYDAEGKPCRGVAGQVFFFNRDNAIPVMVEGDVRVFVFDDQGAEADRNKPLSELNIDRQNWNAQLISTQFGPAYRLFVPYARPGREQAQLAIRLRMTPESGPVVFSDLAAIELAGYKPEKVEKSENSLTTVKVEQALRERLSDRESSHSSREPQLADAHPQAAERSPSRTIATIRTTTKTAN